MNKSLKIIFLTKIIILCDGKIKLNNDEDKILEMN